ncbi:hypothetical protein ACR9E3_09620 [Actinomycetospora sp. C-140]
MVSVSGSISTGSWPRRTKSAWLAQLDADEDASDKDLPDLCSFMIGTGVRIGEALAVAWPEVDLDEATVDAPRIRLTGVGLLRLGQPRVPPDLRHDPRPKGNNALSAVNSRRYPPRPYQSCWSRPLLTG